MLMHFFKKLKVASRLWQNLEKFKICHWFHNLLIMND